MSEADLQVPSAGVSSGSERGALGGRTWRRLRRLPGFWISAPLTVFFVLIALWPDPVAGLFGHPSPRTCDLLNSSAPPDLAAGHPFGFTIQGCDLYASVIHGARNSITVGVMVTLLTTAVAVLLGTVAGYLGGWADALISRVSEIVFAVPLLLGAVVILNSVQVRSVWVLSVVLAVFAWPTAMRVMRSGAVTVRNRAFITAARALGMSTPAILLRHVVPNTIGPAIVLGTLQIGGVIAAEATLTYLGIGFQPPVVSWGLQLSSAQNYFQAAPHLLIYPALMLTLAVAAFVTFGESLRRASRTGVVS